MTNLIPFDNSPAAQDSVTQLENLIIDTYPIRTDSNLPSFIRVLSLFLFASSLPLIIGYLIGSL